MTPTPAPAQAAADAAVAELQAQVWSLVRARFETQRRDRGLTKVALAAQLGVPPSQVWAWLNDPRNMTIKAAARLLAAMDARLACHVEARGREPTGS
ncbi:MAG: helix-turn-helix transcriptional regulator [Phenylobacterium sp.]|uniref:helix-turn-helix domain-containing protein n=1 Tax=Phenylobacterium sp. TaxID=1871053 RepID=UPI00272132F7|nr:helix-turn-helix transcriptional regulator [Phenylobacterium sp.]MDO8408559.1 helix-turn-helix transcriptional regulator [Phenylobacterium sp.]